MFSQLAQRPPLRRADLEGRKQAEVEVIRARAHWDARRRFWFVLPIDDVRELRARRVPRPNVESIRRAK